MVIKSYLGQMHRSAKERETKKDIKESLIKTEFQ